MVHGDALACLTLRIFAIPRASQIGRRNMALLEFYPIAVASHIWASTWANRRLSICCDNLATVFIINKLKSNDESIMKLVRIFTLRCLKYIVGARPATSLANKIWDECAQSRSIPTLPRPFPGQYSCGHAGASPSVARRLSSTIEQLMRASLSEST